MCTDVWNPNFSEIQTFVCSVFQHIRCMIDKQKCLDIRHFTSVWKLNFWKPNSYWVSEIHTGTDLIRDLGPLHTTKRFHVYTSIDLLNKSSLQLYLCVKENAPKNWSYDVTILEGEHDVIYILLRYSTTKTILQPTTIPAHHLTYGWVRALIGNRPNPIKSFC